MPPEESKRLSALPAEQQIAAMAEAGEATMPMFAPAASRAPSSTSAWPTPRRPRRCALRTDASDVYKLTGTPGFIINGTTQENIYNWATLEPKLQAALQ